MKRLIALPLLAVSLYSNPIDSIGFNVSSSFVDLSQDNTKGQIVLNDIEEKSIDYEIYTLFKMKEDIKTQISYTFSTNEDYNIHTLLLGVNKYYKVKSMNLYAGVLAGYGELHWDKSPVPGTKSNDEKASSLVGGVQLGLNYPLTNSLKLNVNSKYLRHNYETKLEPTNTASATLEHKSTASLGLGLVYSF